MGIGDKLNGIGIKQMFNWGESEIRTVTGSNAHEKGGGRTQQGRTSLLL
jgi:hypothetical protein